MSQFDEANKTANDADRISNVLQRNGNARDNCINCHKQIMDGHWFCRLPEGDGRQKDSEEFADNGLDNRITASFQLVGRRREEILRFPLIGPALVVHFVTSNDTRPL